MKRIAFALVAVLFLLTLVAVPHTTTLAAADATCVADPASGPVGTTFVITCGGYTPNSYVYAYLVEPSGAAVTLFADTGAIKVNEKGFITYSQKSQFDDKWTLQIGTWSFVAEELGLAKSVLHRGETKFTITGNGEGVSGAKLSASPTTINKPTQAIKTFSLPPLTIHALNWSEPVTLSGSGFKPYEIVSFWIEPAGGGCASMTEHLSLEFREVVPSVYSLSEKIQVNDYIYDGFGAQPFVDEKADASGNVTSNILFSAIACEGQWRVVARGNSSWHGAETWVTVIGNAVETNAWLEASPSSASAMFARIQFSGSGFGANEHVSCWLTSPQGRTLPYPSQYIELSLPNQSLKNTQFFADANGELGFGFVSGNVYEAVDYSISSGGNTQRFKGEFFDPLNSEGALGEYAMSCRGDTTGNTAIARFTLTGGFVDP